MANPRMWRGIAAVMLAAAASCGASHEDDMTHFMLKSSAFADGQVLPAEYSCDGAGKSPPLQWSEPPPGTKSFALVVDDPDAPSGTFRHWGAYDIPASARDLPAGASPPAQARNDFGKAEYGGACPPKGHGPHRYRFKLLALDIDKLEIGARADVKSVEAAAANHLIGQAELTGTYERK